MANIYDNGEIKNSYPVKKAKTETTDKNNKKRENVSVLNIGQLLFLAFLFMMLLFQSMNIYNSAGVSDLTNIAENPNSDIADTPNIPNVSGSGISDIPGISISDNSGIIYILGEHEGKLAVLSPDKTTVHEVFGVYINTLPVYDRELLREGIKIKTTAELNSLLEDYNS